MGGEREVKVPRPPRLYSNSKIYHIILKGIDDQDIFYDDRDREYFLKQISITKKEFNYILYSYNEYIISMTFHTRSRTIPHKYGHLFH